MMQYNTDYQDQTTALLPCMEGEKHVRIRVKGTRIQHQLHTSASLPQTKIVLESQVRDMFSKKMGTTANKNVLAKKIGHMTW
jgi:hypothetical protein